MGKGIFGLALGFLLAGVSCSPSAPLNSMRGTSTEYEEWRPMKSVVYYVPGGGAGNAFRVITIDGCEYIVYDHRIYHKENCSNPEHKR